MAIKHPTNSYQNSNQLKLGDKTQTVYCISTSQRPVVCNRLCKSRHTRDQVFCARTPRISWKSAPYKFPNKIPKLHLCGQCISIFPFRHFLLVLMYDFTKRRHMSISHSKQTVSKVSLSQKVQMAPSCFRFGLTAVSSLLINSFSGNAATLSNVIRVQQIGQTSFVSLHCVVKFSTQALQNE